jgi:hypothetical protein
VVKDEWLKDDKLDNRSVLWLSDYAPSIGFSRCGVLFFILYGKRFFPGKGGIYLERGLFAFPAIYSN